MMKLLRFVLFLITISTSLAIIPVFADEDSGLEDSMTFHVYDDIDLVSTLKFEYGRPKIVIKSVYPQLASETDHDGVAQFNDIALQIVNDEIAQFRNRVKDSADAQKKIPKDKIANNLYIDYNTSFIRAKKNHILSIRFTVQGIISGNGKPYHTHRVLNYNLDTNQNLTLSDLFLPGSNYLDALSNYTRGVLNRRLHNDGRIPDGTSSSPDNFANWNIKSNGIVITFDTGKVASNTNGTQTVLVPYAAVSDLLAPDSPISDCIKHASRCKSSNLLTGGFIDEAANISDGIRVNSFYRRFNPILGEV